MAFGKDQGGKRGATPQARSFKRFEAKRDTTGFPWSRVDRALLACAFHAATANGNMLSIGQAGGGRGVTVTLYLTNDKVREFAGTVGEFHELLVSVIEESQSSSEDYFAVYGLDPEALCDVV